MSPTRLEPLSPEAERLFANERQFEPHPAELRSRALGRARSVLENGRAAAPSYVWGRHRVQLLLAATLVLVFAAASFAAFRKLRTGARPAQLGSPALGERNGLSARTPTVPAVEPPAREKPESTEPAPGERPGTPAAPRRPSASDADALELGLLQRARGALAKGDFSAVLSAITEHQRRFPSGRLREEREALRVKALLGLGRTDEAQRAGERFRERFPESVLAPRIEDATRKAP